MTLVRVGIWLVSGAGVLSVLALAALLARWRHERKRIVDQGLTDYLMGWGER